MKILNNSPVFTLSEIIVELFDNKFLSDCVFTFENEIRVINAHSFILRARSCVFEKQFETIFEDESKLIPILKYSYEAFTQFMRFIYTDKCNITVEIVVDLLDLAYRYGIPKLENVLCVFIIEQNLAPSQILRIYQFCVSESYQLLYDWVTELIGQQLSAFLESDAFLEIEQDMLEELLKMDYVGTVSNPVKELDIFKALMRWMASYSTKNNVTLVERRLKFDRLIRVIRFPVMVISELNAVIHEYDDLLTSFDLVSFFTSTNGQVWNFKSRQVYTCESIEDKLPDNLNKPNSSFISSNDQVWDFKSRQVYTCESNPNYLYVAPIRSGRSKRFVNPAFNGNSQFHKSTTTFTPDKDLLITGLWIKASSTKLTIITINCGVAEILKLRLIGRPEESILSLGKLIRVQAQEQCIITIDSELGELQPSYTKRRDVIEKDLAKSLKDLQVGSKMAKIFLRIPDN